MFDLLHAELAAGATRRHVLSARPDAPTIPDRPPRVHFRRTRRVTVAALRRLADHMEGRDPGRMGAARPV